MMLDERGGYIQMHVAISQQAINVHKILEEKKPGYFLVMRETDKS